MKNSPLVERPILFSAPMVRAILAGTKTQTRRVVKGQALEWLQPGMFNPDVVASPENQMCPYGQPGDRLWVRETWNSFDGWAGYYYAADYEGWGIGPDDDPDHVPDHAVRWKPSIHMPRAASRITLEITAVRVERLQACSEADAIAEGLIPALGPLGTRMWQYSHDAGGQFADPRVAYHMLWNEINGTGPANWAANPWVWVVEFRRLELPR